MSTQVIRIVVPPTVASPRGARWAAAAVVWITRILFARTAQRDRHER